MSPTAIRAFSRTCSPGSDGGLTALAVSDRRTWRRTPAAPSRMRPDATGHCRPRDRGCPGAAPGAVPGGVAAPVAANEHVLRRGHGEYLCMLSSRVRIESLTGKSRARRKCLASAHVAELCTSSAGGTIAGGVLKDHYDGNLALREPACRPDLSSTACAMRSKATRGVNGTGRSYRRCMHIGIEAHMQASKRSIV
jgi:hypothetical protein